MERRDGSMLWVNIRWDGFVSVVSFFMTFLPSHQFFAWLFGNRHWNRWRLLHRRRRSVGNVNIVTVGAAARGTDFRMMASNLSWLSLSIASSALSLRGVAAVLTQLEGRMGALHCREGHYLALWSLVIAKLMEPGVCRFPTPKTSEDSWLRTCRATPLLVLRLFGVRPCRAYSRGME